MTLKDQDTADPGYNPFDTFVDVIAGDTRDPYPEFAQKRREEPVWAGNFMNAELLPPGIELSDEWIVFRYDDCSRVLRDPKTFTSTGYDATIGVVMGHMILGMDDPEHRQNRNLVAAAFREKSLARWEPEFIAPIVDEQIDRFVERGHADLVRELTFEFPVRVIARILGLPEEDFAQFQQWSIELITLGADIERGLQASESLRQYFAGIVSDRRAQPREDVISDLVQAQMDGEMLDDEAIYAFLRLLLPAGAETTYRSSGNLLYLLLTHTDQLDAVLKDRSLLPQAIEEALRFEPPLLQINRTATREVEIAGVTIPGGEASPHAWVRRTTTRAGGRTPRSSTSSGPRSPTSPLPTDRTCAWACTWPGSRPAPSSTRSSIGFPTSPSTPGTPTPISAGSIFRSPTSLPVRFGPP